MARSHSEELEIQIVQIMSIIELLDEKTAKFKDKY